MADSIGVRKQLHDVFVGVSMLDLKRRKIIHEKYKIKLGKNKNEDEDEKKGAALCGKRGTWRTFFFCLLFF